MIVSCDACKSRYKLDDSKIGGRGAKITCPKCKHVFVVAAPAAAAPPPPPAPGPGVPSEWEDSAPTRVQKMTEDLKSAIQAPPPPRAASEAPPPATAPGLSVHEVASAPSAKLAGPAESPPRPAATHAPLPATVPSQPSPLTGSPLAEAVTQPPAPTTRAEDAPARAATLDFRKVGVPAWKVKVKIGLVYDFSDIKTLRKYIADGRVTSGDVISHDGKTWKPLGEIKDLDLFFCETFDRLQASAGKPSVMGAGDAPAPTDFGRLAAALAQGAAQEKARPAPGTGSNRTSPSFSDPFEALKQRRKDSGRDTTRRTGSGGVASEDAPPPAGRSRTLAMFAVLALLSAAAIVKYTADEGGGSTAPTVQEQKKRKEAAKLKEIKNEIEGKVEQLGAAVPKEEPTPPSLPAEDMKFLPDGKQVLAVTAPPAAAPPVPLGSPPAAAPRGVAGAPPLPANTQVQRDTSAADFEEVGDAEMKQGRHSEAAEAYQRAIGAGASGGTIWRKLGVARKHLGDSAGASEALGKSKAKGDALASCELGDLHESNGDSASAITEFTACLGGKPQNATDIRGRLDRLKGGN